MGGGLLARRLKIMHILTFQSDFGGE